MKPIPYGRQSVDDEDIDEVVRVLRSPFLTQGPDVERFEDAMAEYVGARYAVAVSNATAALHLACRGLGVGPGDLVWTTPNSFVASANCARYCGADVDFVDIDSRTYQIDPNLFLAKLEVAAGRGRLPKALVAVHFSGAPCNLAELAEAARRYGVALIEDASHALGATYRGSRIGDSAYSDATVFSFHPVKMITTGEGGMLVTNRSDVATIARLLRSHGITRDPLQMIGYVDAPWYYEQLDLGHNYRLTDIGSALGLRQLRRLPTFIARRRELAARYGALLEGLDIVLPVLADDRTSAWHLYVVSVNPTIRRQLFMQLRSAGIMVNVHYLPIHLQPYYRALGFGPTDYPAAEAYADGAITLPLFYELTDHEQGFVAATLRAALEDLRSAA